MRILFKNYNKLIKQIIIIRDKSKPIPTLTILVPIGVAIMTTATTTLAIEATIARLTATRTFPLGPHSNTKKSR